jgi:hypothetical protein
MPATQSGGEQQIVASLDKAAHRVPQQRRSVLALRALGAVDYPSPMGTGTLPSYTAY